MRLLQLKDGEFSLVEYPDHNLPAYAILSHTWGQPDEEVTYKDIQDRSGKNKTGYKKLEFCATQAAKDGLIFFWVDTCCIDKSSSAELSEAINSMFKWYYNAYVCYVYLSDIEHAFDSRWMWSRWFTRGWTLQELVAPRCLKFFSADGECIGDQSQLIGAIARRTGIPMSVFKGKPLSSFSVDEKLSWAAGRRTTREEDGVYSLLGLVDVQMSLIYGEGREKAARRLLREIQGLPEQTLFRKITNFDIRPFLKDAAFTVVFGTALYVKFMGGQ